VLKRRGQGHSKPLPLSWAPQQAGTLDDLPDNTTSRSLRQEAVLQMQRKYGNSYVQRMLAERNQLNGSIDAGTIALRRQPDVYRGTVMRQKAATSRPKLGSVNTIRKGSYWGNVGFGPSLGTLEATWNKYELTVDQKLWVVKWMKRILLDNRARRVRVLLNDSREIIRTTDMSISQHTRQSNSLDRLEDYLDNILTIGVLVADFPMMSGYYYDQSYQLLTTYKSKVLEHLAVAEGVKERYAKMKRDYAQAARLRKKLKGILSLVRLAAHYRGATSVFSRFGPLKSIINDKLDEAIRKLSAVKAELFSNATLRARFHSFELGGPTRKIRETARGMSWVSSGSTNKKTKEIMKIANSILP